jgi:hypothetical protein
VLTLEPKLAEPEWSSAHSANVDFRKSFFLVWRKRLQADLFFVPAAKVVIRRTQNQKSEEEWLDALVQEAEELVTMATLRFPHFRIFAFG